MLGLFSYLILGNYTVVRITEFICYCLRIKTLLFGGKVYDENKKKSSLSEVTRCNLWCLIMSVKVIVM